MNKDWSNQRSKGVFNKTKRTIACNGSEAVKNYKQNVRKTRCLRNQEGKK